MTTNRFPIAALAIIALFLTAAPAFAQRTGGQTGVQYNADGTVDSGPVPITTEIVIPGTPVTPGAATGTLVDLAQYLGIVYNFLVGIVGVVAATMMIVGGFQYLTSAGDSGKIGAAKDRIVNAMIGLILALGAYTLLNTINPALLTLKLPSGIKAVTTEVNLLPFCDDLAERLKIPETQITLAGANKSCGNAGFVLSKVQNSDGTLSDSRTWCVWRGDKAEAARKRAAGDRYVNDFGCQDDDSIGGERPIGSFVVHSLAVCVPKGSVTAAELNAEYDKSQRIARSLGECLSCNAVSDGRASFLGWPSGDAACQIWQNVANNGDPKDFSFKISQKGIIQDTRQGGSFGQDDRSRRMYYCGYSANYQRCIYVPILCHRVGECDDYDDQVMNYCTNVLSDATIECSASQTLGSKRFRQFGNAAHIIPVCEGDPCEKGGQKGCEVPGLAGARNTLVGGAAAKLRVAGRVLTGSLTGSISCDAR